MERLRGIMYKYDRKQLALQWMIFACIPFLLDRVTKYLVVTNVIFSQVICSFFNVYVTYNRGVAWGVGSDLHETSTMFLQLFIGCVLIYFVWYMRHVLHNKILTTACMLILSGGISNYLDRIMYGGVVDFIQLHIGEWFFPVFNVADVSITVGAVLLLYGILMDFNES